MIDTLDATQAKTPLERCLLEVYAELRDTMVDPSESLYDDGDGWLPIGSVVGGGGRATVLGETEHRAIREECRMLAATNEYAINGHENRISYLVGPGHTYRATIKKGRDVSPDAAAGVQQVLDEFIVANHWHRRQQEIVRRYDRDGEVFLRFFTADDGTSRVRFVEPGQVATPASMAADPACSFGIRTEPADVESPLAYFIDGVSVDAEEIQHRKANVDANVKRGLPLFFPVRKNLRRAEKLLRNMSAVAEIQSAIALIRKHQNGTRTGVQQFVANQPESTTVASAGRSATLRRFGPGTILDAHGGIEYDFPAAGLDAGNFVAILQAELRAIASRLVMPEFMLTSDASNGNYASTLVAEGPAMRMFARLQAELVCDDLQVMWRVIRAAVAAGRLGGEVLETIEVQATPPSLAVRDQVKEATVQRIAFESGILSPQTWSQRQGLDYDQEQMNIAAHKKSSEW